MDKEVRRNSQHLMESRAELADEDGKLPCRRTKLTPKVQETIVEARASGHTLEVAANKAGITRWTLHNWMSNGAEIVRAMYDPDSDVEEPTDLYAWGDRYADFYAKMEEANLQFQEKAEQQIMDAAFGEGAYTDNPDWRALKWYMQVRWPEKYGDKVQMEHKHKHDHQGKVEFKPHLGERLSPPDEEVTMEEVMRAEEADEILEGDYEVMDEDDDDGAGPE